MIQAYISIGSNLDADKNITKVKEELSTLFNCTFSDYFYSKAEGFEGHDFINLVACFETPLDSITLVDKLKKIEIKIGRDDSQKGMNNRLIDIDLILYGDLITNEGGMILPSPDIEKYLFVLKPLSEIAEKEIHPVLNMSFGEMLNQKLKQVPRNS
tara:strand:- start:15563 stop:16030 length:468 start_codon:yes stop_codon:yes gene_type:complete